MQMATVLSVASLTGDASAQKGPATPRKEATVQFSHCREIAREGDASSCWKLWLKKFKDIGGEAEVAYAEEHVDSAKAVSPVSKGSKTEKGDAAPPAPRNDGKREDAASKSSKPGSEGAGRSVEASDPRAGDTDKQDAKPSSEEKEAHAAGTGAAGADAGKMAPTVAGGSVLDFCAMTPKKETTTFVKKRLVLFAVSNAQSIEADGAVKKIHGGREVEGVFAGRFPMGRFHNVVSQTPGAPDWGKKASLTVDAIRDHLGAGGARGSEEERAFVAYSVGCADYIAVPEISDSKVEWQAKKVKTKTGEKTVQAVSISLNGSLAIFKRQGSGFQRVALLSTGVPSLVDLATDATAGSLPDLEIPDVGAGLRKAAGAALKIPPHISAFPDAACLLEGSRPEAKQGVAGLESCATTGSGSSELAVGKLDERAGEICRKARATEQPDDVLQCEVRVRASQLARGLQKQARSVDGWKLFAPLGKPVTADDPDTHPISLGKDEGLAIGYGMVVLSKAGERRAFFKVISLGPGGEAGLEKPSLLALRLGEAPNGSRVEEYPQLGIQLSPYGTFAALLGGGASQVLPNRKAGAEYTYILPKFVYGAGANVGYDLSDMVGWPETFIRVGGSYLQGSGTLTKVKMTNVELAAEKGLYLGVGMNVTFAIGGRFASTEVQTATNGPFVEQKLKASGYGPLAKLGLELLLSPDASLRAEVAGAMALKPAVYEREDGEPIVAGWDTRKDRFGTVGANIVFGWTFLRCKIVSSRLARELPLALFGRSLRRGGSVSTIFSHVPYR